MENYTKKHIKSLKPSATLAINEKCKKLRENGKKVTLKIAAYPNLCVRKVTIGSVMGQSQLNYRINLFDMADAYPDRANYDPGIQNYLIFNDPKFEKGRIHVLPTGLFPYFLCDFF